MSDWNVFISALSTRVGLSNDILLAGMLPCSNKNTNIRM